MILRVLLIASLVVFVLQVRAAPASALSMCGKYQDLATSLRTVYDEKPLASGTSRAGKAYMEFWASEAGTWTILVVISWLRFWLQLYLKNPRILINF